MNLGKIFLIISTYLKHALYIYDYYESICIIYMRLWPV